MSNRSTASKNFAVISLGICTTILTGILLGNFQAKANVLLYSSMILKIIPVGAIVCGCLTVSGYAWGVSVMHSRVDRYLGAQMGISGFFAYSIANLLDYLSYEEDGVLAREVMSFWHYWQLSVGDTVLSSSKSSQPPIALGELGYFYAFLEIAGFIGGALFVFWLLKDTIYCDECSIDLKRRTIQERYTGEPLGALRQKIKVLKNKLATEPPIAAIDYHGKEMGTTRASDANLRTRVTIHNCSGCGVNHLQCDTERLLMKKYWHELPFSRIIHWYEPAKKSIDC